MGEFSPWHLLIVAVVFIVLFGSKRLPDAARSLGRSMRILKAETAGLRSDYQPSTSSQAMGNPSGAPQPAALLGPPDPGDIPQALPTGTTQSGTMAARPL